MYRTEYNRSTACSLAQSPESRLQTPDCPSMHTETYNTITVTVTGSIDQPTCSLLNHPTPRLVSSTRLLVPLRPSLSLLVLTQASCQLTPNDPTIRRRGAPVNAKQPDGTWNPRWPPSSLVPPPSPPVTLSRLHHLSTDREVDFLSSSLPLSFPCPPWAPLSKISTPMSFPPKPQ